MSKNYKILLLFLLPLISLFSGEVLSGGLYLINGVGLPGTLVIGQKASGKEGAWIVHSSDLKYKVNNKGLAVLIKCVGNKCIADHDITVGTSKGTLLRRYGLPDREQTLGQLYRAISGSVSAVFSCQLEILFQQILNR